MTTTPAVLDGYITEKQLAEDIQRAPSTLARWRRVHYGPPYVKVGSDILYNVEKARRWLASLEQAGA